MTTDEKPIDEKDRTEMWTNSIFGCFDNIGLCCCTFFVPCYTIGRNANAMGEEGLLVGILYGLGFIGFAPVLRWRLRSQKKLQGSMLADVTVHLCCPCCALIQENKELFGADGSHLGEKSPLKVEIVRE